MQQRRFRAAIDTPVRKYGAVYVNLRPMFKSPVTTRLEQTFERARPSGSRFMVVGAFEFCTKALQPH